MTDAAMDRIVAQAAAWLMRLDQSADGAEHAAWRQWHDADPRHAEVWRRFSRLRQTVPDGHHGAKSAAAQALSRVMTVPPRRHELKLLIGGVGAGLASAAAYRQARRAGWLAAYRTGVGEQRQMALSNGIDLMMNTDTALDLTLRAGTADIRLFRGEIMLETAAPQAPLRVLTPHGEITSGQARLAVRLQPTATQAAVDQGDAFVLTRNRLGVHLASGQARTFTDTRITIQTTPVDREFAWTQGILIADDMRLDAFLAELTRYRSGLLDCSDDVADRRINGTFRVRRTDRVLQALAAALALKLVYRTRYWVHLERA